MTSPSVLPSLQEDETIYSWCATAYAMSGSRTAEGWSRHVLGSSHAVRQHDFPAYLPTLLNGPLTHLPVEQVLRQHSLVSMFWPLIPRAFRQSLLGYEPKSSMVWHHPAQYVRRIMLCHSRTLPWESALRFCPACIEADQISCGRAYWHVSHQWPVSRHCIEHRMQLRCATGSRKTWRLPCSDSAQNPLGEDNEFYEVSSVVQRLAHTMGCIDELDVKLLRQAALQRLCALGVIHSTYSVRHERLNEWYLAQPISRWCMFAEGGLAQLAKSDWLPKLLWRRTQDHPIRWIVAWAALDWPSPEYAAQALTDSQRITPVEMSGQLALFKTASPPGTPAKKHPSPTAFEQALESETSYAGLIARLGVSRGDVVRWLEASPDARAAWKRRLQTLRIDKAEVDVRQFIRQHPRTCRQQLNEEIGAAIRLLRQHAPALLEQLLAAVPSRLDLQRSLFNEQ